MNAIAVFSNKDAGLLTSMGVDVAVHVIHPPLERPAERRVGKTDEAPKAADAASPPPAARSTSSCLRRAGLFTAR